MMSGASIQESTENFGNAKDVAFVDNRWSARYLNVSAFAGISIATLTPPVSAQAHL